MTYGSPESLRVEEPGREEDEWNVEDGSEVVQQRQHVLKTRRKGMDE